MYSEAYEALLGPLTSFNWVLGALAFFALPVVCFYGGMLLIAFGTDGDPSNRNGCLIELSLPFAAALDGLVYALATIGAVFEGMNLQHSLHLVVCAAEIVAFAATVWCAFHVSVDHVVRYVAGNLLLGFSAFGALALIGGLVLGTELVGIILVIFAFIFVVSFWGKS